MREYTKFFKSNIGYDRFINCIYDKYKSLGKFSGVIKLSSLNKDESFVLTRLFGITMKENDNVSLSVKKFIDIMKKSKFSDFDISVLISEYLNVVLSSKKEDINKKIDEEERFYDSFIKDDSIGSKWLKHSILNKDLAYNILHKRYKKNKFRI